MVMSHDKHQTLRLTVKEEMEAVEDGKIAG